MSQDPPKPSSVNMLQEMDGLLGKQAVSFINNMVEEIGRGLEDKIKKVFEDTTKFGGKSIKESFIEQLKHHIDNLDENDIEHHLNHFKPKYTIQYKKLKQGGKNKTRKRKQSRKRGGAVASYATHLFASITDGNNGPKEKVKEAIESKLQSNHLVNIIENAFYRASYSLPEPSSDVIKARDIVVKGLFDMSTKDKYENVKNAILGERCNKKNKRNRKKECRS